MRFLSAGCLAAAFVASTFTVAAAQQAQTARSSPQQSRPAPPATPAPAPSPGMALERLPPSFVGANLAELIADLKARLAQGKDPFETTADFEERRRKLLAEPLADGLPLEAERIFVLNPPVAENAKLLTYDADRRLATWDADERSRGLSVAMGGIGCTRELANRVDPPMSPNQLIYTCAVQNNRFETLSEKAVTRMGVPFTVSARYHDYLGVIFCNLDFERRPGSCGPLQIQRSIPLEPDRARELLGTPSHRMRVAAIGHIAAPYVVKAEFGGPASLDSPRTENLTWTALNLRPVGLLFFDKDTGEILMRLSTQETPASRGKPATSPTHK